MEHFKRIFQDPPQAYSAIPFWFLNDDLEPEKLKWQLREMKEKGIYACILHARKGMTVAYLSEEWFDRIGIILEEAKRLNMQVIIYDEDNWPSGYAGGQVVRQNPDYAAKCLSMEKIVPLIGQKLEIDEVPGKELVSVCAVYHNETFLDITDYERHCVKDWTPETLLWEVYVVRMEPCRHTPAYSDAPYVDLLNEDAVRAFMESTHAEYKRRFPAHWGSTIIGFFTDEPGFYQNYLYFTRNINTVVWTRSFPAYFRAKRGYDLMPYIGALWDDWGEISSKTRRDYYQTVTEMYNEHFFRQIYDFCEKDGLISMGHIHKEEHLQDAVPMEGHFFEDMQYLHIPGIDRISRDHQTVTEKLGSSAAHIYNRDRCASETYGCYGWQLTLEEMKTEADRQFVRGINMLVPHAFFSSIDGIRKTESPPSLFYQNPYWAHFKMYADYIRRLSWSLTQGDYAANFLVYYPIESCWENYKPLDHLAVDKIDENFIAISNALLDHQLDYDYISDDPLVNSCQIHHGKIVLHHTSYACVIVPNLSYLPPATAEKLSAFERDGGIVYHMRDFKTVDDLIDRCCQMNCRDFIMAEPMPHVKYMHRRLEDAELYFITNEGSQRIANTAFVPYYGACTRWDLASGKTAPLPMRRAKGGGSVPLDLDAGESLLLTIETQADSETVLADPWIIAMPDGSVRKSPLSDWQSFGLADFSGHLSYEYRLSSDRAYDAVLDLGVVHDIAEVFVNGAPVAELLWRPYQAHVRIQKGDNTLQIKVCNTLANELTDQKRPSGLLGPVKLIAERS